MWKKKRKMDYDLNRPWLTLDPWQKEYIETQWNQDCFLLSGRQCGKTTALSIKAVEMCINDFSEGDVVLISSLTERQAMIVLKKAQIYAEAKYSNLICKDRDNKPTMHRLMFKAGKLQKGILCYAAGEEGDSTRGYTLKKLMVDEGSRMDELYFVSALPTLSVSHGSMDIASTPAGTKHEDGSERFFYKCSKDETFKKFYVSAEDCPRHTKEFLLKQKERMSRLEYAQEYLAQFLDEIRRLFNDEMIKTRCILKRRKEFRKGKYYYGGDVAGFGKDVNAHEILDGTNKDLIEQVESEVTRQKLTTETTQRIKELNINYNFKSINVDDGGLGFGVFSELMSEEKTKNKTFGLNNASRPLDNEGVKSKKLLKEEMYINLLRYMEQNKILLLDDDEIKASLSSIQYDDEGKIFGSDSHIAEGIIRALWGCIQDKSLNMFVHSF